MVNLSQILYVSFVEERNENFIFIRMTKMAAMPIYGKNPSKIFWIFSTIIACDTK